MSLKLAHFQQIRDVMGWDLLPRCHLKLNRNKNKPGKLDLSKELHKHNKGVLIRWMESGLSKCTVEMIINGNAMRRHSVTAGVSQGWPISRILFEIYTSGQLSGSRSKFQPEGSGAYMNWAVWWLLVIAAVPVLELAGIIGLRGNGLTTSKIDDFLCESSL
jgi:hypothetical protein